MDDEDEQERIPTAPIVVGYPSGEDTIVAPKLIGEKEVRRRSVQMPLSRRDVWALALGGVILALATIALVWWAVEAMP